MEYIPMISTLLIALSLSMDAFAVSVSSGICTRDLKPFHILRASFAFGVFQFLMPVIGWYLGTSFRSYIEGFDHWIAFGLLALIGIKMIIEAFEQKPDPCAPSAPCAPPPAAGKAQAAALKENSGSKINVKNPWALLTLAVATSIDALAIGLSYSLLKQAIWVPAAVIGGITFAVCLCGFEFGKRIGLVFEKWAQIIGGTMLLLIGIKILAEHLFGFSFFF